MTQRQTLDRQLTTVALLAILTAGSLTPSAVADEGPHIVPTDENGPITPIPMGVSGGNIHHWVDIDGAIACRTGTLGALVQDTADNKYILSANHVLARTNLTDGQSGPELGSEFILQPGLVDQETQCDGGSSDPVAELELSDFVPITGPCTPLGGRAYLCANTNFVDAAIAAVLTEPVRVSADIQDIGPICNDFIPPPTVGMPVFKSGRTSGLTSGEISAVDGDVLIQYSCLDCTDDPPVYRFVDQFLIKPGSSFALPGDSGSAVIDVNRRLGGLVFAGSKRFAVANRFDRVADAFSITAVGVDDDSVCGVPIEGDGGSSGGPGGGPGNGRGRPSSTAQIPLDFAFEQARDVRARHADRLFSFPGVVGSGVSVNNAGNPVIEVYLAEGGNIEFTDRRIPEQLEGIAVRQLLTGPFVAY